MYRIHLSTPRWQFPGVGSSSYFLIHPFNPMLRERDVIEHTVNTLPAPRLSEQMFPSHSTDIPHMLDGVLWQVVHSKELQIVTFVWLVVYYRPLPTVDNAKEVHVFSCSWNEKKHRPCSMIFILTLLVQSVHR